jgi:hypothetical protein
MNKMRLSALAVTATMTGALLSAPATSAVSAEPDERVQGRQTFVLLEGAETSLVIGKGVIHAKGTDVVVSGRVDRFEFPDGNLTLRHKVKKGTTHEHFDTVTCYGTFTERGTWRITDGTGAYADARGSGTYRVSGDIVGCDEDAAPEVFFVKVNAKGTLSY